MYVFAFALTALAMLCAWGGAMLLLPGLWGRSDASARPAPASGGFALKTAECAGALLTTCLIGASGILLYALVAHDFSLVYAADYTDRHLPLFYRITGFWAGQAGSLLFWALCCAVCGTLFQFGRAYRTLNIAIRSRYQVFYLGIMAFFCLLLITWSNPFLVYAPHPPADGNGMNPLLRNPGMIFHPPLLFMGYAGFLVPGCLALAHAFDRSGAPSWIEAVRPFFIAAWALLTAGIVLGAWWAYMELGWGGYWAWDPVENASLLPWLIATAALHTMVLEERRDKLHGANVLLMGLTTVAALFATYLTRSGVVQSVHAFGDGGVGTPLLLCVAVLFATTLIAARAARRPAADPPAGLESREGFVILTSWLSAALTIIILLATLWPVLTALWNGITALWNGVPTAMQPSAHGAEGAVGLTQAFYNLVCLPLFAVLIVLLAICPHLAWKGGFRDGIGAAVAAGVFCLTVAALWLADYRQPTALLASGAACAVLAGSLFYIVRSRNDRRSRCAALVHAGIALMVLGIAFSGPYKTEIRIALAKGESVTLGDRQVTLKELFTGNGSDHRFLEALLEVRRGDHVEGTVAPQQRIYFKRQGMTFAEAAVLPSPGREFYAALLGLDDRERAVLNLSLHPLVNWIWIGGILVCLAPLFMLGSRKRTSRC